MKDMEDEWWFIPPPPPHEHRRFSARERGKHYVIWAINGVEARIMAEQRGLDPATVYPFPLDGFEGDCTMRCLEYRNGGLQQYDF